MPEMPGLPGEVYFGDVDAPLPNWRKESIDESDSGEGEDEEKVSPERRKTVAGMLGFEPWEEAA